MNNIPLSLYIHLPWCIQKCPYCDFNSHRAEGAVPEQLYVERLLEDFRQELSTIQNRKITTIFIGGGTPSLFSAKAINHLLSALSKEVSFAENIEITMEANPGTVDESHFQGYLAAGVNRLSLGVQSFQNDKLKRLGRIHSADEAKRAIEIIHKSGFKRFNIDIMHGLPNQTTEDAISDLATALSVGATHLSWYQLTIEPNTVFYKKTPKLPSEQILSEVEQQGLSLLANKGFERYEISAFAKTPAAQCQHNVNYWLFGDYIGIGAGAHSKITQLDTIPNSGKEVLTNKLPAAISLYKRSITRHQKQRLPRDYLNPEKIMKVNPIILNEKDIIFEFMLNALRLYQAIEFPLFEQRTGIRKERIANKIQQAIDNGLLEKNSRLTTTSNGKRYLNDLLLLFSPD